MHYLRWRTHGDPAYELLRPTVCAVEGCERPVDSRGWCTAHYLRWRRHGDPQGSAIREPALEHANHCSVEGCDRPYYAHGWCRRHYDRHRHTGDPTASDRRVSFDPFSEEFWDHVDSNGGADACWPWKQGANAQRYGTFKRGRTTYLAHRTAFALTHGPIPKGLYVLHRCDNPPCCNPAHLFLGTHADNMADMRIKGRARGGNQPGARNNFAKLTAEQVAEIRQRHPGESQAALARQFGISQSHASRIISGKQWCG